MFIKRLSDKLGFGRKTQLPPSDDVFEASSDPAWTYREPLEDSVIGQIFKTLLSKSYGSIMVPGALMDLTQHNLQIWLGVVLYSNRGSDTTRQFPTAGDNSRFVTRRN
jgi:hypothetical protein